MTQQSLPPIPEGFSLGSQPQAQAQPQPQEDLPPIPEGFQLPQDQQQDQSLESTILNSMGLSQNMAVRAVSKIAKLALGTDKKTETSQSRRELIDAPAQEGTGIGFGFNLLSSTNPDELTDIVREEFGEESIRIDEKGNTFALVGDEEFIINRPGFSKQDLWSTLGQVALFAPAAKAATFFRGIASRVGVGGAVSAATQTGVEAFQTASGGEFDTGEILTAGAFGAVGELPSALIQARRVTPEAASLLPQVSEENIELARRIKNKTGITLLPSQASGQNADKLLEMTLANTPELSGRFQKRFKEQSGRAYNATASLLTDLASKDASFVAASDVSKAAGSAVDAARTFRTKQTSPIYNQVFGNSIENKVMLDIDDLVSSVDSLAETMLSPKALVEAENIKEIINRAGTGLATGSNVQPIHKLKMTLSDSLTEIKKKNQGFVSKEVADLYKNTWEMTRQKLIDEVPGYDQANTLFRELSPAVDLLEGSKVGDIANIDPNKLKQVANTIFDWSEFKANRGAFRDSKEVIQGANPEAWNALLRNKIEGELTELGLESAEQAEGATFNAVEKMFKKVFTGKNKQMYMEALDGDAKANFNALSEAFDRSRVRAAGSQTAPLSEINERLKGSRGFTTYIRTLFSGDARQIVQSSLGGGGNRDKNIRVLGEIFLDPNWMDRMTEIRKLGLETPAGGAAFAQVFKEALNQSDQEETK